MSTQILVVLAYFVVVTLIGLWSARKAKNTDGFLIAGRGMGTLLCAAAIAGEWIGGTSTVGVAEGGYRYGVSATWYTLANAIGTIILALTLARLYRRSESFTVTGFMEKYYDHSTKKIASVVLAFVMIVVGSVQIVAGGTLMTTLTGVSMTTSIIATGIVFLVCTLAGGLWAIAYTNLIHVVVMYVGLIIGLVMTWRRVGGLGALTSVLPAEPYFSMTGAGKSTVIAWIIASVFGALVAQAAVQPLMGAKDERTAQRATLLAALIVIPSGLICALLGMYAKVSMPGIQAKAALPSLMMALSPGMAGVVLAGILAAILSTVSPCILAAGTLITKDVYQGWLKPAATPDETYRMSKVVTLVCGLLAIAWATYAPVLLDQVYFAYTLRATIAMLLVAGVYLPKMNRASGKWALVLSTVVAILWEIIKGMQGTYPWRIHPMYAAAAITVGTVAAFSVRGRMRNGIGST